jgi:hypothetical protein
MDAPSSSRWDYEVRWLAWLAACVSIFSFLHYFQRGDVLLYGDAVAHINVARRVFDSKTPGLLQLGTVWLPLPHLLMLPFVISDGMWRSGAGGSIPSMIAYVFSLVGMFRLIRGILSRHGGKNAGARVAAWSSAVIYGANQSLIYMQTTAMGEPVYLCFFLWALVYFSEFTRGESRSLTKCGFCLLAASLTRYDGWFLAAVVVGVAILVSRRVGQPREKGQAVFVAAARPFGMQRSPLVKFLLISAAGPVLWLGYNAVVYRNPLEFANGPYSAHAVEQKTRTINPAKRNLMAAGSYFLKSAELNVARPVLAGRIWLGLSLLGSVAVLVMARSAWPILLLWAPLPFYAMSIAYGAVPIFVPTWWPFSLYNVRYGLELLPALSAMPAVLIYAVNSGSRHRMIGAVATLAVTTTVIAGYYSEWHSEPICLREALVNSKGRIALETQLATWLKRLPANSTLLMYLGEHPGALQHAGIPLKRVINEGDHRVWKHPTDPDGMWERAIAAPERFASYVIAFEGDPVFAATQGRGFKELVEIEATGQPRVVVFQAR